jgi:hypothetical protein
MVTGRLSVWLATDRGVPLKPKYMPHTYVSRDFFDFFQISALTFKLARDDQVDFDEDFFGAVDVAEVGTGSHEDLHDPIYGLAVRNDEAGMYTGSAEVSQGGGKNDPLCMYVFYRGCGSTRDHNVFMVVEVTTSTSRVVRAEPRQIRAKPPMTAYWI